MQTPAAECRSSGDNAGLFFLFLCFALILWVEPLIATPMVASNKGP
jgi:hypothetical protein